MIKRSIKAAVRPVVRALRPALEYASRTWPGAASGAPSIQWFNTWTPELDTALSELPEVPGCGRDQYRLLTQPSEFPKRHALARENGAPTALISLRRRTTYWEPVTYQALPGVIAPASSAEALGRALATLGIEVRVNAGLTDSARDLNPSILNAYETCEIDLRSDYEAYWKLHKGWQRRAVQRARTKCATMETRIDNADDLNWIITQWREMWRTDPTREIVAAPDRLRFWPTALGAAPQANRVGVHVVQLLDGQRRVAGMVLIRSGDRFLFQCTCRDLTYDDAAVGTRVMDASIAWAASTGAATFFLGGGSSLGHKEKWAPKNGVRYEAIFRPKLMEYLHRFDPS
ncbi:MAG: GNAT family N-acetyltransferase [Vitreimonas sp.]